MALGIVAVGGLWGRRESTGTVGEGRPEAQPKW